MRLKSALICAMATLAVLCAGAAHPADKDQKYTKEAFKSDVKSAGKGI